MDKTKVISCPSTYPRQIENQIPPYLALSSLYKVMKKSDIIPYSEKVRPKWSSQFYSGLHIMIYPPYQCVPSLVKAITSHGQV